MTERDKHTSLVWYKIDNGRKKFYKTDPKRGNLIYYFFFLFDAVAEVS